MDWLEISPQWKLPLDEIGFEYSRSSGPGGQNVNKVSSRATLRWNVRASQHLRPDILARFLAAYGSRVTLAGELLITSQRFRDQERNRADCLERLAEMLRQVERPPKSRRATRPTRGSRERRLAHKRQRSQTKERRRGLESD
ncbi:MAG: alternative ribosome rescue aminoacyl-tRNA hydrolase ArfB [Pirellulales bacterium]